MNLIEHFIRYKKSKQGEYFNPPPILVMGKCVQLSSCEKLAFAAHTQCVFMWSANQNTELPSRQKHLYALYLIEIVDTLG